MKKLNKILSVGLSLVMCASMVAPGFAASFTDLQNAIDTGEDQYNDAGNISIGASKDDAGAVNVTLYEDVTFEEGDGSDMSVGYTWGQTNYTVKTTAGVVIDGNVTIDLNGNDIDGNGQIGSVVKVNEDANLTLKDSAGDGAVTGGGNVNDRDGKSIGGVYNEGTFNLEGGSIEGNVSKIKDTAAGVTNMNGGTFNMSGGSIKDNKGEAQWANGGVYNDEESTFNLTGGSIEGNKGQYANSGIGTGGVYNDGGEFNMSGGTIANNKAGKGAGAGGVENAYGGTFTMTGGSIEGNESYACEGAAGVWNRNGGVFDMSGGTIEGNAGFYGGVYNGYTGTSGDKPGYSATFHMSGDAKITGNIGEMEAGGVASRSGTFTMSDNASVTGNMSLQGGGVTVKNQEMTMSGNATIADNISPVGAGIIIENATLNMSDNASIQNNNASLAGYIDAIKDSDALYGELKGDAAYLNSVLNKNGESGRGGGILMTSGELNMSGKASLKGNKAGSIGDEICAMNLINLDGSECKLNVAEGSEWKLDNPESREEGAEEIVFMGENLTGAVQENDVGHTLTDLSSAKYPMTGLKFHKGAPEEPETPDNPDPNPVPNPDPVPDPTPDPDPCRLYTYPSPRDIS